MIVPVTRFNPININRTIPNHVSIADKPSSVTARETASPADRLLGTALERATAAARVAEEMRGTNVHLLDLRGLTQLFDYFVIVTGTSRRQLHAIADEIAKVLKKDMHDVRRGIEGYEDGRWIVLDYGDVVVHLFDKDSRDYWDLEQLWSDARMVALPAVEAAE